MSDNTSQGEKNALLRQAERHFDRHNFQALLELASDVCLPTPLIRENVQSVELDAEARLVNMLGAKGLSIALDAVAAPDCGPTIPAIDERGRDVYLGTFSPLRQPEYFGIEGDLTIQQDIKSFGIALLSVAYESLGSDVNAQIAEFRSATTVEEQLQVLAWLEARINAMKSDDASDNTGSDGELTTYHPARLSPKLLGQYPTHNFDPTCLGISVLTASFIEQCDVEYLHSGAVELQRESAHRTVGKVAAVLAHNPKTSKFADNVIQRLQKHAEADFYSIDKDPGFHGGTAVRLLDGSWFMIDPNFGSHLLSEDMSEQLQGAYCDITGFGNKGITIERIVTDRDISLLDMFSSAVITRDMESDIDGVAAIFDSSDEETLYSNLYQWATESAYRMLNIDDPDLPKGAMARLTQMVLDQDIESCANESTILIEAFDEAFEAFFMWGESREATLKRLADDPAYRQRRMDDAQALPYLMLYCALTLSYELNEKHGQGYKSLELGDPAMRVGATVLSDFATYCGDDMSYTFWVSNWPSRVPISERYDDDIEEHESGLARNNLLWLGATLRYAKQNGIVSYVKESETKG